MPTPNANYDPNNLEQKGLAHEDENVHDSKCTKVDIGRSAANDRIMTT